MNPWPLSGQVARACHVPPGCTNYREQLTTRGPILTTEPEQRERCVFAGGCSSEFKMGIKTPLPYRWDWKGCENQTGKQFRTFPCYLAALGWVQVGGGYKCKAKVLWGDDLDITKQNNFEILKYLKCQNSELIKIFLCLFYFNTLKIDLK